MPVPSRLDRHIETEKQKHLSRDFMVGWEAYETWEEATVGQSGLGQRTFKITEEDILEYNRACGETDPLIVDPDYARKNSPTGELLQHPIFVTTIAFYSLGERGIGTWIRTPDRSSASRSSSRSVTARSLRRPSQRPTNSPSAASPTSRCCWTSTMRKASSRHAGGVQKARAAKCRLLSALKARRKARAADAARGIDRMAGAAALRGLRRIGDNDP
jgi:hypothetical protein